jgi:hypothetical protein
MRLFLGIIQFIFVFHRIIHFEKTRITHPFFVLLPTQKQFYHGKIRSEIT